MHIHSSHQTSPGNSHMHGMCRGEVTGFTTTATTGNSHMHGMCRGEVTVFYHHRNDREQPHARNVWLFPVVAVVVKPVTSPRHIPCMWLFPVVAVVVKPPQQQGTATCTECVEAKSRVLPPQQQGTATCTKVSRRSTSLLDQMRLPWGGFEPTTPRIRQDPGALPLSYHDLMSVRANF